jgi:hypothetical protein
MNEVFEPTVESFRKAISGLGTQAKEKLSAQVRREPAKTVSLILAGSIVLSLAIGYQISRMEQQSRRQRLLEDGLLEVRNWIKENGWKIGRPVQEGVEATKSAVHDVSNYAARRWLPFIARQTRSLLNLF